MRRRSFIILIFITGLTKSVFSQEQKLSSTSSVTYAVNSIPYAPYSFTTGTSILTNQDDIYSAAINLGFTFNFFGSNFTQCVIGSNGIIAFSLTVASAMNNWQITNAMPNNTDLPGNTICAAFRDIDPTSSGNVFYSTFGVAPNRYFVVNWTDIPMFDNPGPCSLIPNSTFQAVLYETSNHIEIYIDTSAACTAWNSGYGIVGIQDSAATTAYVPPARNYPTAWTAAQEGWCIAPSAADCPIATRLNANNLNNSISVFPNPSVGKLILMDNSLITGNDLRIFNILGEMVYSQRISFSRTEMNLENISNGIYYLKVISSDGNNVYQTKLIKQ
jgi:hypothetical protein